FARDEATWLAAARSAHAYVKSGFPPGSRVRRDDVARALVPVIEVRADLRARLDELKLRPRCWVARFADLIIDRAWTRLTGEKSA
ncbi:MAG: hypothetical protein AB7K52_10340, partial [Phycisphaerales bacterium]